MGIEMNLKTTIYLALEEALNSINKQALVDFIMEGIQQKHIRLAEDIIGGKDLSVEFVASILIDIHNLNKLTRIIKSKTQLNELIKWKN
jgi:hypothetical protein